jgi:ketosteroid isomerase-like protein
LSVHSIENEVIDAANNQLNAKTAKEALSHYTKDIIAISNEKMFRSFDELAKDVNDYYKNLKKVNLAEWKKSQVQILNGHTVIFTAEFSYSFTDKENKTINLDGIWSAVFVNKNGAWKICFRHESFSVK